MMHPSLPVVTSPELVRAVPFTDQVTPARSRPAFVYPTAKRALDVLVAVSMLLILSPGLALIALWIKWTDGGPVIFRQTRVGKGGRTFTFYKFRSMVVDADALKAQLAALNEHADDRTFKMKRDPRVTRIGRFIRKASIDELPQLINVLAGDMTLVGPRPAVPDEVSRYTPYERHRLDVTPGLTCFWQVGGRADLEFSRQVELDLRYVRERSFWLDLKLMARTVPAVLSGRGAY